MPDPRYLSDPEEEPDPWFDIVQADDWEEARKLCQEIAQRNHVELTDVREVGDDRYECHFE